MAGGAGGRIGWAMATAALVAGGIGCSGDESRSDTTFGEITAGDVIEATEAAGTARARITTHASTADPPDGHGRSGYEEQDLTVEAELDFAGDRSVSRWEISFDDMLGSGMDELLGDEFPATIGVEARSIGDTAYVRDGSWLCPGCPIDGHPLPRDKWITVPISPGGPFVFTGSSMFSGELGWLALVESPLTPQVSADLEGEPVGIYEASLPVADVQRRLDALPSAEYGIELQGETVTITFSIDSLDRLRHLAVSYRESDRDQTITATLSDFGEPTEIEPPPDSEIYRG